ncbi:MAG: carbohydrate ABC transporter permease, partial [Candidatus Nanopelagicales bacterium]
AAVLLLAVASAITLFTLWWMFVVSLETPANAGAAIVGGGDVLKLWPEVPQWGNYAEAIEEMGSRKADGWGEGFKDALANSTVITVLVTVGTILSSSLVGFAFARVRFRGLRGLFLMMLATMMLPPQVTMIPLFLLFRSLGWIDTILPLVVPAFFGSAFFQNEAGTNAAMAPERTTPSTRKGSACTMIETKMVAPVCRAGSSKNPTSQR